jgi:hypothetical protein
MATIVCNRTSPLDDDGTSAGGEAAEGTVFYGIVLCIIAAFVLAFSMNVSLIRSCNPIVLMPAAPTGATLRAGRRCNGAW